MKRIFPAVKLRPQTTPVEKREIGDAAIPMERRIHTSQRPPPPPSTRAITQWARSLEWRHVVTLRILVGKICITFFPFSCEACSLYLVLWLCNPTYHNYVSPPSVTGDVYCFPRWQPIFSFDRRVIYHLKGLWEYIPKSIPSVCMYHDIQANSGTSFFIQNLSC